MYYDERYKDLVVDTKHYGPHLFKNLSDGQRIVLTLVGDLVRRAATLNPHLADRVIQETSGVVLIDELDLHLHPKWQRHVAQDLKNTFPNIQFIATTHSPQLIGETPTEEVIPLSDGEATNPAQSFGMDSNWILQHVMGVEDRDPSIKRRIDEIERLIGDLNLQAAKNKIVEIRSEIGNHRDLVRFSAQIDRLGDKHQ